MWKMLHFHTCELGQRKPRQRGKLSFHASTDEVETKMADAQMCVRILLYLRLRRRRGNQPIKVMSLITLSRLFLGFTDLASLSLSRSITSSRSELKQDKKMNN